MEYKTSAAFYRCFIKLYETLKFKYPSQSNNADVLYGIISILYCIVRLIILTSVDMKNIARNIHTDVPVIS